MKFAHFSHVWNRPDMTVAQRYEQLWREVALCDELGFDFAFAVEHHFRPIESWMPSPAAYCATAAAHTQRIRLGPMGYVVPLYDPIRIVEEVAVLDNVLNGRMEVGLVSGIVPEFFVPYKADFKNRRHMTNEVISLLKTAFTAEGPFSFEGRFHQYEDVTLSVKPIQKPHPPMWLESRDPETLAFLASEGVHTGYLMFYPREEAVPRYQEYLRLWEAAAHPEKPNISYWTIVYVDETDAKAVATATPHIQHAFNRFAYTEAGNVNRLAQNYEVRGEWRSAEIARNVLDVQYLLKANLIFVGSPVTVAAKIREAAQDGMFNTLLCEVNMGTLPEEDLMRSLRLLGTEVMPALRDFQPY